MIETDIFNGATPEFFRNMKSIPDKMSVERPAFVKEERRKCREGININGVPIVGGLYHHLNYYHLTRDGNKAKGEAPKITTLPDLRDIDWIVFNDYHQAQLEGKIYPLFGLRQIGKSEIEVSLCLREINLYRDTEAIGLFASQEDKDTFVKKAEIAISHGEKFIFRPNIDKDWSKKRIRFGYTKPDNEVELTASLYLYLTQEGRKIQVASGKTVSFVLMDEIAKSDFRLVYQALEPALETEFGGLRCAPFMCFTGGEVEKSKDAEDLVKYPDESKQVIFDHEGKPIGGRFLTGHYRRDCKKEIRFADYIQKETGTWLDDYTIKVTDFEVAQKKIDAGIEAAKKSPNEKVLRMHRMFYPQTLDDVFLTENENPFDVEGLQRHLEYLKDNYTGKAVDLFVDEKGDIQWKNSNKKPILEYPTPKDTDLNAPIVIYDFPKHTEHYALHVAGFDPVNNVGQDANSDSLPSVFVMRRNHTDMDDPYRNCIVAEYTARPKSFTREYLRNLLLLQQFYNMQILHEDSGNGVTLFFDQIRKSHLLMDTYSLQKSINPNSKANSTKGLKANPPNNAVRLAVVQDYCEEELDDGRMGYQRIPSPALVRELIEFDGMGKESRNTDRFDAFSYAVLQITSLEKYNKVKPFITHTPKEDDTPKKRLVRDAFGRTNVLSSSKMKRNAFGMY